MQKEVLVLTAVCLLMLNIGTMNQYCSILESVSCTKQLSSLLLDTHSPFSKKISWSPSFMDTTGLVPIPGVRLVMLSEVKLNESSSAEMLGTDSAFLLGGFFGVLNEDRENNGIFVEC